MAQIQERVRPPPSAHSDGGGLSDPGVQHGEPKGRILFVPGEKTGLKKGQALSRFQSPMEQSPGGQNRSILRWPVAQAETGIVDSLRLMTNPLALFARKAPGVACLWGINR